MKKLSNISYRPPQEVGDFAKFGFKSMTEFLDHAVEKYVGDHTTGLHEFNETITFISGMIQKLEIIREFEEEKFTDDVQQLLAVCWLAYEILGRCNLATHESHMVEDDEGYKRGRYGITASKMYDDIFDSLG